MTSAATTSINGPGGVSISIPANYKNPDGRPVSLNFGDFTISIKSEDKGEQLRDQKRIERAPSVTSKHSKRSVESSAVSSYDHQSLPSRRPSRTEERPKQSRQHSRAPSPVKRTHEYTTSRRQSVDLNNPKHYDEAVWGF
jgi:hypothetical protein